MNRKQRREELRRQLRARGIGTREARVQVSGDVTGRVLVRCVLCGRTGFVPADDAPPPHIAPMCARCVDGG
jgi:hypothetical protein